MGKTTVLGIGVLVQIVACAVVGTRLCLLARRTREIPELALGVALLLLGGAGYPLGIAARLGLGAPELDPGWLLAGALAIQDIACMGMALATWLTFRADAGWARAALGLAAVAFVASIVGHAFEPGYENARDGGPWYWLGLATRTCCFAWPAVEAAAYSAQLRKRLALGLADPVVADRIRLWAITCAAAVAAFVTFVIGRLVGVDVARSDWVLGGTSFFGLVSGGAMWLAFFPPASYLRRVTSRASA